MFRLIDRIGDALATLSAWMFFAIGGMILWEVFFRYLFTSPTIWAEELARFFQIWALYIAAASVLRQGAMIRIGLLIDRLGPESSYITEDHTFNHFRKFWNPKIFDRSFEKLPDTKDAEDLLNQRTIDLLKNHQPKPLSKDLVKELKKVEKSWFDSKGLKHEYPQNLG